MVALRRIHQPASAVHGSEAAARPLPRVGDAVAEALPSRRPAGTPGNAASARNRRLSGHDRRAHAAPRGRGILRSHHAPRRTGRRGDEGSRGARVARQHAHRLQQRPRRAVRLARHLRQEESLRGLGRRAARHRRARRAGGPRIATARLARGPLPHAGRERGRAPRARGRQPPRRLAVARDRRARRRRPAGFRRVSCARLARGRFHAA